MKLGTVIGVNLSDDDYNTFSSVIVKTKYAGTSSQLRCYPLTPNTRSIPVIGEQVYILTANSDDSSGVSGGTRNYYVSVVGIQRNLNHNALPGGVTIEAQTTPNFSQVENGIPLQDTPSTSDVDLGGGFEEIADLSQLQPFLGDIIYEGRFGQSIRFGSTPQNTTLDTNQIKGAVVAPSWNSSEPNSPITIIRNGAGERLGYNKFVIENVDDDDSSIWLTSKQRVGLSLSSNLPTGTSPISQWESPQIILNSDRIVLNSRTDDVILAASNDITLTTSANR